MNTEQLTKYLNNPSELNNKSIDELNKLINAYPYFQTAHLLCVRNLKNIQSPNFDNQLKVSALFVQSRERLFELVFSAKPQIIEAVTEVVETSEEKVELPENNVEQPPVEKFADTENKTTEVIPSNDKPDDKKKKELADIINQRISEINNETAQPDQNKTEAKGDPFELDDNQEVEKVEVKEFPGKKPQEGDLLEMEYQVNSETTAYQLTDNEDTEEGKDLIDSFLKSNPKIVPKQTPEENNDISVDSVQENEELMSDTLAKIYITQGYFDKAIKTYEKLSLKYPEKNSYFASQIEKIKNLSRNQ